MNGLGTYTLLLFIMMATSIEASHREVVINPNKPIQEQFTRRATYVIRSNVDLQGGELRIPAESIINFESGSIRNGSITFNGTLLQGKPIILTKVEGSIINRQLFVDWFMLTNDLDCLFDSHIFGLDGYEELVFSEREYVVSVRKSADGLQIKNKTLSGNNCTIRAKQGGNLTYCVFPITKSEDVYLKDFTIVGSKESAEVEGSRHNLCISYCRNIIIENVTTIDAFTDGLYLRGNEDVKVNNLIAKDNGRQGCSITSGKNILISNSVFSGSYRVPPMSGLDIEPSIQEDIITGVSIVDCKFFDNKAGGLTIFIKERSNNPKIEIAVQGCEFYNNNINLSVRSNPNSGTGKIVLTNNKLRDSRGTSFQSICYSTVNTPHVYFLNNRIANANLGNGKDVRGQAAFIAIHNISSVPVMSDIGNITISDVVLHQDESLSSNIYRAVSLYVDTSRPYKLANIELKGIRYDQDQEFTDSYNNYMFYVPKGRFHNITIEMPYTVTVGKSLVKALTPSPYIEVTGNDVVSLKQQVRTDLFDPVVITCREKSKVKDISADTLFFPDGSVYDNRPIGGTIIINKGRIQQY